LTNPKIAIEKMEKAITYVDDLSSNLLKEGLGGLSAYEKHNLLLREFQEILNYLVIHEPTMKLEELNVLMEMERSAFNRWRYRERLAYQKGAKQ
jgi:hypothetical protein